MALTSGGSVERRGPNGSAGADGNGRGGGPDPIASLLLRVADHRDAHAFERLFEIIAPRIKAYLLRNGVTAVQADDLTQETLLSIWRKADYFDPGRASAAAWIFTIARNLKIDSYRQQRVSMTSNFADMPQPDAPPGAEALLLAEERERQVRRAMDGLPGDQVAVIASSFFQDKPHAQIAHDMNLPLGTVKSRIRNGLSRLRDALRE